MNPKKKKERKKERKKEVEKNHMLSSFRTSTRKRKFQTSQICNSLHQIKSIVKESLKLSVFGSLKNLSRIPSTIISSFPRFLISTTAD